MNQTFIAIAVSFGVGINAMISYHLGAGTFYLPETIVPSISHPAETVVPPVPFRTTPFVSEKPSKKLYPKKYILRLDKTFFRTKIKANINIQMR